MQIFDDFIVRQNTWLDKQSRYWLLKMSWRSYNVIVNKTQTVPCFYLEKLIVFSQTINSKVSEQLDLVEKYTLKLKYNYDVSVSAISYDISL